MKQSLSSVRGLGKTRHLEIGPFSPQNGLRSYWRCTWSPPTSARTWRKLLWAEGRCGNGLPGLCCGGQPLHRVLWGAGTGDGTDQTQAVEEVRWWHFLHPQEGLNRRTPTPSQRGQADHQVHCGAGRGWDTPVPRHATQEERGWRLDVSIYRKPTHTDKYLHFESHHPTHVKRGVVRCLHDRAREIISTQDNLQKEVDHLARVLKQNGYPAKFIRNASAPTTQETADASSCDEEQEEERAGMSEDIRRVCRKFNIRVVFKSGRTLHSMLTKVKDTLPLGKQSNVVYRMQVYIGETRWRLETRLKEYRDACERGMMEKSAVAEHAWENHHPIDWEETTVLDHGRGQELLVKEALHIQMTPSEERFNRDGGLEVPGCWTAVMRRQGGRSNPHQPLTSNDMYPQ